MMQVGGCGGKVYICNKLYIGYPGICESKNCKIMEILHPQKYSLQIVGVHTVHSHFCTLLNGCDEYWHNWANLIEPHTWSTLPMSACELINSYVL